MRNKTLIYKKKFEKSLSESFMHFNRLKEALEEIKKRYNFPLKNSDYEKILNSKMDLAFCDQVIYRFSKLQDTMGEKLFKSMLLYQGENVDKPFLDILNRLEKMNIIDVEEWFYFREIRNEIAHEYEEDRSYLILNEINEKIDEILEILEKVKDING